MKADQFRELLDKVAVREVSFGYSGIRLFSVDELEIGQIGYSIDSNGNSLTGENRGDWQKNWIVFGKDTGCGDPIFADLENDFPVLTAMHGVGAWDEEIVSRSFDGFAKALEFIHRISKNRDSPVSLENSPISNEERDSILREILKLGAIDNSEFWRVFFN